MSERVNANDLFLSFSLSLFLSSRPSLLFLGLAWFAPVLLGSSSWEEGRALERGRRGRREREERERGEDLSHIVWVIL